MSVRLLGGLVTLDVAVVIFVILVIAVALLLAGMVVGSLPAGTTAQGVPDSLVSLVGT